jgi:3-methyladenine DNA glycosylase AlkC
MKSGRARSLIRSAWCFADHDGRATGLLAIGGMKLKLLYSPAYIDELSSALAKASPGFDRAAFVGAVLGSGWRALELKQRMRRIAQSLADHVPGDFRAQLATILEVATQFDGFRAMLFPDFVELCGMDDFEASVPALALLTRYSSSEYAVRPFIVRYGARMLAHMRDWAVDENEHVRRLASEGCRPRLPWGIGLVALKADPAPILPILEALRADPSEYVRRSVANNLNDIAKDHPDVVLGIARRWLGTSAETDKLVKHACRTLLKRGDQRALALFGQQDTGAVTASSLKLESPTVRIGETLTFSFELVARADAHVRIEYGIDFLTKTGGRSRKVFKVADKQLNARERLHLARRHRFTDFTTRTHYPGHHELTVFVNGVALATRPFLVERDGTRKAG